MEKERKLFGKHHIGVVTFFFGKCIGVVTLSKYKIKSRKTKNGI